MSKLVTSLTTMKSGDLTRTGGNKKANTPKRKVKYYRDGDAEANIDVMEVRCDLSSRLKSVAIL